MWVKHAKTRVKHLFGNSLYTTSFMVIWGTVCYSFTHMTFSGQNQVPQLSRIETKRQGLVTVVQGSLLGSVLSNLLLARRPMSWDFWDFWDQPRVYIHIYIVKCN